MAEPYYSDAFVTIYHGDCRDVLGSLDPVETCITDPPYGLEFMGRDWDHGVPGDHFWSLVLGALLPGAMLLAFGGTRTYHRLTCAIEDAGFEIRDCLMWLYGSGFPKSLALDKAIDEAAGAEREVVGRRPSWRPAQRKSAKGIENWSDSDEPAPAELTAPATDAAKEWNGWGTALKPAWEPIVLAMKPLDGTFAQNALEHGVAGLNIDGCRIGFRSDADEQETKGKNRHADYGTEAGGNAVYGDYSMVERRNYEAPGRWPANVVLDEDAARMLDEQSGERASGNHPAVRRGIGFTESGGGTNSGTEGDRHATDSGGASRFFYTSKASRSDRGEHNTHPTVKPSDLMKWLVKLTATPTGGTVLDPFMGSGTTLYAAKELGRKAVGIELNEEYCEIAAKRLAQGVLGI